MMLSTKCFMQRNVDARGKHLPEEGHWFWR